MKEWKELIEFDELNFPIIHNKHFKNVGDIKEFASAVGLGEFINRKKADTILYHSNVIYYNFENGWIVYDDEYPNEWGIVGLPADVWDYLNKKFPI